MQAQTLESEVRNSLQLVGIRSVKHVRTVPPETLFEGIAEDVAGSPERVQIRIVSRNAGGSAVTIEGENSLPIEQASFASARDALLKAAVQWEARHPRGAEISKTMPLDARSIR
jgi:hypothetical protein